MKRAHLADVLQQAAAAGLVPPGVQPAPGQGRPWPLVLLSGFGAWMAALLLMAATFMVGRWALQTPGSYIISALALAASVAILRGRSSPLFVEQLALPVLLLGIWLLAMALTQSMGWTTALLLMTILVGAVAALVPQPWLRALLGAAAACFFAVACAESGRYLWADHGRGYWRGLYAALVLWLAAHWLRHAALTDGRRAPMAALLEAMAAGWSLVLLVGLAIWSSVMMYANARSFRLLGGHADGAIWSMLQGSSVVLALAAAAWAGKCWPGLRTWWCAAAALVMAGLAWFMPGLGAVLVVLAVCVCSGRMLTACAAALAAAWMVGAFYYQLAWPLADKALLLAASGAALGLVGWVAQRAAATPAATSSSTDLLPAHGGRGSRAGIVLGGLLVLAAVNAGIWQKQDLIAHGRPVYVALAPVDPRSLMQGDYMRLNFAGLNAIEHALPPDQGRTGERPLVVLKRDARGVAGVLRVHAAEPLAGDELLIALTPMNHGWTLVSDAWFFKEGEGERWSKARYGEFRVGADGRALLVDLRGADLDAL